MHISVLDISERLGRLLLETGDEADALVCHPVTGEILAAEDWANGWPCNPPVALRRPSGQPVYFLSPTATHVPFCYDSRVPCGTVYVIVGTRSITLTEPLLGKLRRVCAKALRSHT